MTASSFISGKLSFKTRAAVASIVVSILVIIIAIAVSSGFRGQISSNLRTLGGDLQITGFSSAIGTEPITMDPLVRERILDVEGVETVSPVVYSTAVVRREGTIQGVVFKGVCTSDSASLKVSIPSRLAQILQLESSDRMTAFFISESVTPRNFTVSDIYDSIVTDDDKLVVFCDIHTLRRVLGLESDSCTAYEVNVNGGGRKADDVMAAQAGISSILYEAAGGKAPALYCERTMAKYPQLFDWLHLVDTNVNFILILMIIVAAVNMVSGLLILLFENMGTIGLLKALGMTDRAISATFLKVSARLVATGMAIGTLLGLGFCLLQARTHLLKLDPVNYFVSSVPIEMDPVRMILYELLAFTVIMLILLLPCKFISRIDPAKTVKEN